MYKWREEYFFSQFGECPSCDENSCWFSEGFSWDDECYCDDTFSHQVDVCSCPAGAIILTMFSQVTVNFDEVVALACGPRPALPKRIFFEKFREFEIDCTNQYDGILIKNIWTLFLDIEIHCRRSTYTRMLHIFFAVFQSKPLSLRLLAMRKALELKLEVKDGNLPSQLRFKECASSQEIFTTADQIMPFIAEKDRGKLEELKKKFGRD